MVQGGVAKVAGATQDADGDQYETIYEETDVEDRGAAETKGVTSESKRSEDKKAANGYDSESDFLLYKSKFTPILGNALKQMLENETIQFSAPVHDIGSSTAVFIPSQLSFGNLHGLSRKDHKRLQLREYVDMVQTEDLSEGVKALLYKLKELYFIRKIKP